MTGIPVSAFMIFVSLLTVAIAFYIFRHIYLNYDIATAYTGQKPLQFGGWLLLPMAGIIFVPIIMLAEVINAGFFKPQMTDIIFNHLSPVFNQSLGVIMVTELVINTWMIAMTVFCIVLLFKKRSVFPNLYITLVLLMFGTNLLYLLLIRLPAFQQAGILVAPAGGFLRLMVQSFIWIPYMLNSERVKKTFTRLHSSRPESQQPTDILHITKETTITSRAAFLSEIENQV